MSLIILASISKGCAFAFFVVLDASEIWRPLPACLTGRGTRRTLFHLHQICRSKSSLTSSFQVYSFVPIPGAQQHKRPRRRYEEIERMYKCGWNGCEKAYGTLNHLNAHVTMQSHGAKRTPEGMFLINSFLLEKKKSTPSSYNVMELPCS